MQLLIEQSSLASAMSTVGRIVPRRPVTPVVSTVHLSASAAEGRLRVRATDLQNYADIVLAAQVHLDGQAAVDARYLHRIAATLSGDQIALSLSQSGESLRITAGSAAFRLRTVDADEFPVQRVPQGVHSSLKTDTLIDLIERTTFCARDAEDEVSPFAGVLVALEGEQLAISATDGYQLAHYRVKTELPPAGEDGRREAVVPTHGLSALTRALATLGGETADLLWHDRSLWCRSGAVTWRLRQLDLKYPNLSRYTGPLAGNRIEVGKEQLLGALRQVATIADDGRAVGLRVDGARLHLFASHREVGEAQAVIPLAEERPPCEVWLDAERLVRSVRAQPERQVALYISEPLAPVVLAPASGAVAYRTVLTPLRYYVPEADVV